MRIEPKGMTDAGPMGRERRNGPRVLICTAAGREGLCSEVLRNDAPDALLQVHRIPREVEVDGIGA